MLNGLLTGDELSKAARMLKLEDTDQYCVVSFHTISSNSEDYYTKEELEEIGVIEGEIQRLLPDEHIYRNLNQIVCIHEIKLGKHKQGSGKKWKNYIRQYRSRFFTEIRQRIFRLALEVLLMDMEI